MIVTNDDRPHPVPPYAYVRYKENWFFIIIDVENSVFGMAHFNYEPGYDRARVSCNLMVRGESFQYGNQIPFPKEFAYAPQIGDDRLTVSFVDVHERFDMRLQSNDVDLELTFLKSAPTFDYEDFDAANPDKPSAKELMNFATNQLFEHQQQALTLAGTLKVLSGKLQGETIRLKGLGYRDHSRAMRVDNMVARHFWTCLQFPGRVFGCMSLTTLMRPTLVSNSGYVHDADGLRALRDIDITASGSGPGNLPAKVQFKFSDIYGKSFTVVADIAGRHGFVPLQVEAPNATGNVYNIVENFCPIAHVESGAGGQALVEIGFNSKKT